jgi:DNA mismatch endonuclease, patch repair protein
MTDVHNRATRSYNMSRIRSNNTKPEVLVRQFLHANGFRFRLHVKRLPGKPEIVLKKYRTVIQIHGCFWHGHDNCKDFKIPSTRTDYWVAKITRNKENDKAATCLLQQQEWRVITIWACQLEAARKQRTFTNLHTEIARRKQLI